jgi:hypothetical protein
LYLYVSLEHFNIKNNFILHHVLSSVEICCISCKTNQPLYNAIVHVRLVLTQFAIPFMMRIMEENSWRIYLGEIPYSENKPFWVSFESDPRLKKTRSNIYGRCLPCIQNLYFQLKAGDTEIHLGTAFNCWKVTAVLKDLEQCLLLLDRFQSLFPSGHVYGKFGSGRPDTVTKVVVFHTENESERDRIQKSLKHCFLEMALPEKGILISRACAVLYENILGDWRTWRPMTPILYPERVKKHLERIKKILFWSAM